MEGPVFHRSARYQRRTPLRGFTLVELLVVIAILALLVALLLPALTGGQSRVRATKCLSQLQQWSKALQLFASDHADAIPRRGQGVRPLSQLDRPEDWFNALAPELGIQSFGAYIAGAGTNVNAPPLLFVCPQARPAPERYFLTYAMNMYLSPWNRPESHRMGDIPTPSTVVFLGDGGVGYSSSFPAFAEYSPQPRHRGRAVLVFLDGHAGAFKGDEIGSANGIIKRADVIWRFDTATPPFTP